jgi:hypothetical protein
MASEQLCIIIFIIIIIIIIIIKIALGTQFAKAKKLMQVVKLYVRLNWSKN